MQLMSEPWVTKVTIEDGGQIMLTVQVDGDFGAGTPIEISGYASQSEGAFASFYSVQPVTILPDETEVVFVKTTPVKPFIIGHAVTVVLRAARVWVTVLTQSAGQLPTGGTLGQGTPAADGTAWTVVGPVGEISPDAWSAGIANAASAAGARFPSQ
jgi:hypothetical protein